jgi:hypothetical protein
MDTLVSLVLAFVRDLTGYSLLRMFGIRRANYTAATVAGFSFWMLVIWLLMSCAHRTLSEARAGEGPNCPARLQQFVDELEELLPHTTAVASVQLLFKKHFPMEGCDPDKVLAICKKSKYCSDQSAHPSSLIVGFDSRPDEPHSGIYVQFSVDRQSGDARLPFVKVKL